LQGLIHIINSNPKFKTFYDRKINGKSKGTVRSALVRKTFKSIYYMQKNEESYRYTDEVIYNKKLKQLEKTKKNNLNWLYLDFYHRCRKTPFPDISIFFDSHIFG
jgi:hypothetical protein